MGPLYETGSLKLYLQDNNIRHIDEKKTLKLFPDVKDIKLSNNKLKSLNLAVFKHKGVFVSFSCPVRAFLKKRFLGSYFHCFSNRKICCTHVKKPTMDFKCKFIHHTETQATIQTSTVTDFVGGNYFDSSKFNSKELQQISMALDQGLTCLNSKQYFFYKYLYRVLEWILEGILILWICIISPLAVKYYLKSGHLAVDQPIVTQNNTETEEQREDSAGIIRNMLENDTHEAELLDIS